MNVISSFQNGNSNARGRVFPGMHAPHPAEHWRVEPRGAICIAVKAGDTLSVVDAGALQMVALDQNGDNALSSLGLTGGGAVAQNTFDATELRYWCANNGGQIDHLTAFSADVKEPLYVLSASADCTIWIINPAGDFDHISASATSTFQINVKRAAPSNLLLPDPLGEIREEFTISRATAQAYHLNKGEFVQVIDVAGQQCSDFMAFRRDGLDRGLEQRIDSTVTRSLVGGAYPGPGLYDKFYDSEMRPLINVVQDTVGRHDTFALACTARGYEERGFPGHVNCSDNISDQMDAFGVKRRSAWPAINFFFNSWIDPSDNRIQVEESWSRPGDYVAMQAMDDLVCVSTACPDDVDPINGWNPTDIHIRIYKSDTPIRRAVAHREKEDARMSLSENSAFHASTSKLTDHFAPARNLWMPVSYPATGPLGEYWACRDAVTLQDMSSLRKYDVVGPDAERLLQHALTRNIAKLSQWRGTYTLMCDAQGTVIDDGTLFRLSPQTFRWCCGSEESARHLKTLSQGLDVRIHDMQSSLPNLALQGPKSRDVLRKIVFTQPDVPALDHVKWFGVTVARLNDREGVPFMLSRSGYTGELGYELFCSKDGANELWDALMDAGQEFGIEAMGGHALETIRIEAGLAAAGAEFTSEVDAFEAGLGFAVDLKKDDFIGKEALARNAQAPRRVLKGMLLDCDDVPAHGAHVYEGERPVGVVTSATRSPSLERAIAMVRVSVEQAQVGTPLEIGQMGGHMKRLTGTICDIPFIDPRRERARA